jgi:2'-5' RNA ligase
MATDDVPRLRSFVAVPLPAELQQQVLDAARGLTAELPAVKWSSKVENLHVTVRFLGDVAVASLPALSQALIEAAGAHPAFTISLRGFGAFPDARHASTLWVGVEDSEGRLGRLVEAVEQALERLGMARERRPFHPHVTVGRCKAGMDARGALDRWRGRHFGTVAVTALHLYESRLGRGGSTYLLRSRAPLAASPAGAAKS